MAPTLQDGDQVRIVASDPSKLQPGEVVMYVDAGNQIIIHRVVRVEGKTVITRGDNRGHNDPPVTLDQVLGTVEKEQQSWNAKHFKSDWPCLW